MNKYIEKVAANWGKIADRLAKGNIPKSSKVFKQPTLAQKLTTPKSKLAAGRKDQLAMAVHNKGDSHLAKYRSEREKAYLANREGDSAKALEHGKGTGDSWNRASKTRENAARLHLQENLGKGKYSKESVDATAKQAGREVGEGVNKFLERMKQKHG